MPRRKPDKPTVEVTQAAPAVPPAQPAPNVAAAPAGVMPPGYPATAAAQMPGAVPPGMPAGGNPMWAMMQMMQMMMGGGGMGPQMVDPAAIPFSGAAPQPDADPGLDADIIRPATLEVLLKTQEAVPFGSVLDLLCLTEDGAHALGGLPKGCTMAFVGPPGAGKTRTALAGLARVAQRGVKVALVVAEEGFHDSDRSGRDDLGSRLAKIGMTATGLDEQAFRSQVLEHVFVMQSQYHKGQIWDDFVTKYRYLVEKEQIELVVIDSLNMLDPSRSRTADNLSALKTYNHEKGITCLCIGQIRDTGMPVGGEALQHTADAVFLIEELTLGSKEIAAQWGGKYRDRISVIRAVKSVTTPTLPHPVRVTQEANTGCLVPHPDQPAELGVLPPKNDG